MTCFCDIKEICSNLFVAEFILFAPNKNISNDLGVGEGGIAIER